MRIAVLMTCHNRQEKTIKCLRALLSNEIPEQVSLHIILVDDGSTDGTGKAVSEEFPEVEIISGDGSLFWARGMHKAFAKALADGFDFYLWLNDDTILFPNAIFRLLTTRTLLMQAGIESIIVGSTCNDQREFTYGGKISLGRIRRFRYREIIDFNNAVECEVTNGNCLLISNLIASFVGNIDPEYEHGFGDFDYSLRTRALGYKSYVAPGYFGICANNPVENSYLDKNLDIRSRWSKAMGRSGIPVKSWKLFTSRHGGIFWIIYFIWPYFKLLIKR